MRYYFIYGLVDPSNGRIEYVGSTHNPYERYCTHLSNGKHLGKSSQKLIDWFILLKERGIEPEFKLLEMGAWTEFERYKKEEYWCEKIKPRMNTDMVVTMYRSPPKLPCIFEFWKKIIKESETLRCLKYP